VKAGFDSVVFDRSALPFEQNIRETRQAVEELKAILPLSLKVKSGTSEQAPRSTTSRRTG
jgi:fructose/tagatose bisphosphate aldolase